MMHRRFAEYDSQAASAWFDAAAAGQVVSALEHNSAIIALAMTLDSIANPQQVATHLSGTDAYRTVVYYGPNALYNAKPVAAAGFFPAPDAAAAPQASMWFRAVQELVWRLARVTIAAGSQPDGNGSTPALWAVYCASSEAILLPNEAPQGSVITEDPNTAPAAKAVYRGAVSFAARLYATTTAPNTDPTGAVTDDETTALPIVQQLAAEYATVTRMHRAVAGGVGAVAALGAAGARFAKTA